MTTENKIVFSIFSVFLIYGIQSYFASGSFIVPIFLNKLFYLLASLLFCAASLISSFKSKPKKSVQKSHKTYHISLVVLVVLNLSWVVGDTDSTNFITGTFHLYNIVHYFENFEVIITSFVCFVLAVGYFFILLGNGFHHLFLRLVIVLLGITFVYFSVFEYGILNKLVLIGIGLFISLLLIMRELNSSKSIEVFSSWLKLIILLEALTFLTPLSPF